VSSAARVRVRRSQDFRQADLALLRALVPQGDNDIFVVGDAHQRIYGHRASLGAADISIRGRRSRKLRINYRTTEEIRAGSLSP
jgi:superfamily I DNA/RNA helicase